MSAAEGEEDDIPNLLASDLKYMTLFYRSYLIGKILGETIPIKFISGKRSLDWKVSTEVNLFVKFTNESLVIEFLRINRGLLVAKCSAFKDGKKISILLLSFSFRLYSRSGFLIFLLKFWRDRQ